MKLRIATPAYKPLEIESAVSFASLVSACQSRGDTWTWDIEAGDSNHARAWNLLFHRFLMSDDDVLVGIDTDQTFTPEQIYTLVDTGVDYVMATITKRSPEGIIVGAPLEGGEHAGPLLELHRAGFGVFAVSRACIQRMTDAQVSRGSVFAADTGHQNEGQIIAALVDQGLSGGRWVAADDIFSDRWRALGGRLWLHTGVRVGHVGTQVFRCPS